MRVGFIGRYFLVFVFCLGKVLGGDMLMPDAARPGASQVRVAVGAGLRPCPVCLGAWQHGVGG